MFGLLVSAPSISPADELTSPNFRHRSGSVVSASAVGAGRLTSSASVPVYSGSASLVGVAPISGAVGSAIDLTSLLPGFLALVTKAFPSLDIDGDLVQFFLDPDDDGDGLEDVHETATGLFVSATNTGSSPTNADSDGDGFDDGIEVASGSDPNDPGSTPPPQVPSLAPAMRLLLFALLMAEVGLFTRIGSRNRRSP